MKASRPSTTAKAPVAPVKGTTTVTKTSVARPAVGQLFDKENFTWMLIGAAILILGFLLMAGGGNPDPNVFNASEVYSARRITVAPIVILIGIVVEIYAIFRQPKKNGAAEQ